MDNEQEIKQREADKQLLNAAANEIRSLRNANQLQSARLDMFDSMMTLFRNVPYPGGMGMSHPDVLRELEMKLGTMDAIAKM